MNTPFKPSVQPTLWVRRLVMSGFAAIALCAAVAPASAQRDHRDEGRRSEGRDDRRDWHGEGRRDWGGDRRDWHGEGRRDWGDDHYRYRGPPPPVYYQQRQVYAPPPVYYAPPRGPSLNLFLPFGG